MNVSSFCGACCMICLGLCLLLCCASVFGQESDGAPEVCAIPATGPVTAGEDSCAVPKRANSSAPTSQWSGAELRNTLDPISGEVSTNEFFLSYSDEATGVYGRVYFASKQSHEKAAQEDLQDLYMRAYLTQRDGTQLPYGATRLKVNNSMCPVSGVGASAKAKRSPLLEFHPVLSVNCTAGACSVGDGYKVNYNAIQMNSCCPTCAKAFGEDPAKHIRNIWTDMDAALSVEPDANE